ncbi:probable pterin-4-alpha-carbinolamine dehydratase, chloroplastic [Cicer arietinum]|uniref:4a-hydroxytetrahydrobiopterin dehydratase n=1 Tax=Cicer arietinum TaxID=3827 RepID=A0A1S2YQB7_CICAR|nr:probable pterin-4-alpha-carbinolamine dehydratase, chloroplastic [Cicer arietinum]
MKLLSLSTPDSTTCYLSSSAFLPSHSNGFQNLASTFKFSNNQGRCIRKAGATKVTAKFELKLPSYPLVHPTIFTTKINHHPSFQIHDRTGFSSLRSLANDFLGDFGARDPFPAELESKFGEKVLGNVNTEHKILIPNISALSLSQQDCTSISPLQHPISQHDATQLVRKVLGWRLVNVEGVLKLQCLWKLRDFKCGVELINRIYKVVEAADHFPNIHIEQPSQVRAELWTASIGGLSMNDFIVAAKIDEIKTSDLVPRKRVWA